MGTGTIRANGGDVMAIFSDPGGSGGGGRVAIEYTGGVPPASSLMISAFGGAGSFPGGAGTVFVRDTANPGGESLAVEDIAGHCGHGCTFRG